MQGAHSEPVVWQGTFCGTSKIALSGLGFLVVPFKMESLVFGLAWTTMMLVWWRYHQKKEDVLDMTILRTLRPLNPTQLRVVLPTPPLVNEDLMDESTSVSPMSVVFDDHYLKSK